MAEIFSKWTYNLPNDQGPPKFTQIGIFGLKMYHLATLNQRRNWPKRFFFAGKYTSMAVATGFDVMITIFRNFPTSCYDQNFAKNRRILNIKCQF
jgi:hypothetical protein